MDRTFLALGSLALVIAATAPAAAASTIAVGPGQSIQAAILSAHHGDRIELAPGVYHEAIDFLGKRIAVVGTGGPAVTVLDGTGLGKSVVTFKSHEIPDSLLEGVTVTGAVVATGAGGGIRVENFSNPTVRRCRIAGNRAPKGGGMSVADSSATIEHCLFEGNVADGFASFPSSAPVGGLLHYGGTLIVRDCIFAANAGGGLGSFLGGSAELDGCTFDDHAGHPAARLDSVNVDVHDCSFHRNSAQALLISTYGGYAIRRCSFVDNASSGPGGALLAAAASGPPGSVHSIRLESCVFARNHSTQGSAARLAISEANDFGPEAVTVESCTFVDNGPGAAIHSTVDGSTLDEGAVLHGSIFRGSAPIHAGDQDPLVVAYCDVQGGSPVPGAGNFDVDPQFVDPAADDYHLKTGSPCIGAGDPAGPFPLDADGNARDAGGANEIGADESKPALAFSGTATAGATVRVAIHGDPTAAPALLFLGTAATAGPGAFHLALPIVAIALPPLAPDGSLAFSAVVPAGIPPLTVYAQAWTGSALTPPASLDVW